MPNVRACDACKRRKVRCDAGSPCANCRISQLRCEYRIAPRKRGRKAKEQVTGIEIAGTLEPTQGESHNSLLPLENHFPTRTCFNGQPEQPSSGSHPQPESPPVNLGQTHHAREIYVQLVALVNSMTISGSIENVINICIDLFAQYIFPNSPVAHQPTLRAAASLFREANHPNWMDMSPFSEGNPALYKIKAFTLITALCAFVASIVPDSLLHQPRALSQPFLQSSKAMLRTYEEHDLEYPDSTSLTIRMWLSAASQNTTGKPGATWNYQGEAVMLAQRLRLYDELAVARDTVLESQLLRAIFWALYLSEMATAALENRPVMMHELLFDGELTLLEHGEHEEPLLEESKFNQGHLQSRLAMGFQLKRRIWSSAADLVVDIKSLKRRQKQGRVAEADARLEVANFMDAYLDFAGLLDSLPPWLRDPDSPVDLVCDDKEVVEYQKTCFWSQRSNITNVFYCTSLVILQKCIENNVPSIMGLDDNPLSWAARKLEIVQNFLQELQRVPFVCLKVQGEAGVERVRRVGSLLLEMVHNIGKQSIKERAKSHVTQLLSILAKLDSKACDELDEVVAM
ncbi:uncharacterized protein N7483_002361 [Penicillium malachiteum]|uniref:uncharacterized protein n=1 Tax=Penicillium malachiteum TaxID=1324776 RepID=UPI0025497766|nr:uncharacterized protein N7483_002361 [Penicillium malachiteum]KAJ5737236.1 hypothetical protein N7483_002361 [Penicillium malachiteum]